MVALADPHGHVLLQLGPMPQGGEYVDCSNEKRVHFRDVNLDDGRPSASYANYNA
jgi:hypothetical protein